jgi:hypothetical protein
MSVCLENTTYTFTLSGGHPGGGESLTASVFKYTDSGLVEYALESYDPLVDSTFTFTPGTDGVYNFRVSGSVSGQLDYQDFLVDLTARSIVSGSIKDTVDSLMCGECPCDSCKEYNSHLIVAEKAFKLGDYLKAYEALSKLQALYNCNKAYPCGC